MGSSLHEGCRAARIQLSDGSVNRELPPALCDAPICVRNRRARKWRGNSFETKRAKDDDAWLVISAGALVGDGYSYPHLFLLLLGVCMGYASMLGMPQWHGFMLWTLLFCAVAAREAGRAIAAAYHGLQIRSVLLLPIGGLMSFANADSVERSNELSMQIKMAAVGPLVSLSMAVLCVLTILGAAPAFSLWPGR